MKGYIMYKIGHVTFKKEYIKNFEELSEADIFIRLINFKRRIDKSEEDNVNLVFKGRTIAGHKEFNYMKWRRYKMNDLNLDKDLKTMDLN